ncbi:peptide-methionine (R)-S-oxide reductase MsrB [Lutimonas zeaxanthinifaciens]|uniref:peptide-methionine (R)-S-oxide reductase MsrB n=1 Tax=Lutimonas zeaxanthinifaciens TaxID=3060215 RepID=UPI00265CA03D|nr:peptide-methionine (R)-S-oxide reductase MsrB [Lutimonas sp. YSD2104]WKK65053.1 peptide-methionine (R)-S-oxide reductase MsrB [Lutimonas sp. YSD2104]
MKTFIALLLILSGTTLMAQEKKSMERKVNKTEEEWKQVLTPQQYYVLREKGTDRPGDGGYTKHFEKGTYHCAACDAQLFESGTKYESHCGWPSFDDAIKGSVEYVLDKSHGMIRTEIICTSCGGHLGHVFDDGPRDTTGKRYCVNTSSIRFEKSDL